MPWRHAKGTTREAAVEVVRDRLERLRPILSIIDELDRGGGYGRYGDPGIGPQVQRWLEGSCEALHRIGLQKEAVRLANAAGGSVVLQDNVQSMRGTLESLIQQAHADPEALGFRYEPDSPPASPTVSRSATAEATPLPRVAWPWVPLAALVGFAGGLYGRGAVDALSRLAMRSFGAAQMTVQHALAWIVDAATPGPPLPIPAWIPRALSWLLVGVVGFAAAMLVEVLGDDVRRDGPKALWHSRRSLAAIAILLAAAAAALAAR